MLKTFTNSLINEKSPYLLQHAHNPVNWYPWGKEAFEKAKREDKPVFLSIGYSTCHWCHVMERESFENEQTAEILNKYFISIKVDREERPDVDAVYMSVCISLTGNGGWPLTLFLTPEQKPFYAATYLPKISLYGMTGLDELLLKISEMWRKNRKELLSSAEKISKFLKRQDAENNDNETPDRLLILKGAKHFKDNFDEEYGGFGSKPKFPSPHNLLFLMKYSILENDKDAFDAVEKTLIQMYRGGIFDHIGGGFSRYSTDDYWLVPHFEKMLYDNALLTLTYVSAFEITKNPVYQRVAKKTIGYVLRELTHEDGGFYCGQDADSEGIEGKYYVFTPGEIDNVFKNADSNKFCRWFDITKEGNFEGKSIPNLLDNEEFDQVDPEIETMCDRLYLYRLNRTKLHKDDKILLSWNALMIAALAKASRVLEDEGYLMAAKKAVNFIDSKLTNQNGRLLVRFREGDSAGEGKLDDYAFYAYGLLSLYEMTLEEIYLKKAVQITKMMTDHFFDHGNGGFYLYADDGESLISRPKEVYDGAIPSGNSVAGYVLNKLSSLTAERVWGETAEKQMKFLAGSIKGYPAGFSFSLYSMTETLYPHKSLVCVSKEEGLRQKILKFLKERNSTDIDVIVKTEQNAKLLEEIAQFTSEYPFPDAGASYYLCKNKGCLPPVYELEDLKI